MVSLTPAFLAKVDGVAAEEGRSRSELIREALRQYFRTRIPEGQQNLWD